MLVAQFGLAGYAVPQGPDAVPRLYLDPVFRAQEGVILAQVVFMFLALWGVVAAAREQAAGLVLTALLLLVLWQVLELVPRAVDVFAAGEIWAPAWAEAATEADRAAWATVLEAWQGAWSALGVIRRIVWGVAHLLLGLAFVARSGLGRWLGVLFLFNALRLLPRTTGALLDLEWLAGFGAGRWWFVAGMVPLFGLAAVWLWREAARTRT